MPQTKIIPAFVADLPCHDATGWHGDTQRAGLNRSVGRRGKTSDAGTGNDGWFMRVPICGRMTWTEQGNTANARILRRIRTSDEKADLGLRRRRKKDADTVPVVHVWGTCLRRTGLRACSRATTRRRPNVRRRTLGERRCLRGGTDKCPMDGQPAATKGRTNGWQARPSQSNAPDLR